MDFNGLLIAIVLGGFLGGQLMRRWGLPSLLGMVGVGVLIGASGLNWLTAASLTDLSGLRAIAVMVILMKAGLGLDAEKLQSQGSVAIRLGMLPGLGEMVAIACGAVYLLGFDWLTGLLLGAIVGAESPAVIVPAMLKLKSQGWGVSKGIPDAILAGSALSNGFFLLIFSLLINLIQRTQGDDLHWLAIAQIPLQASLQIIAGIVLGWLLAKILIYCLTTQNITQTALQDALVVACSALGLILLAQHFPFFSGYLAVMALGFSLTQLDPPLARHLRTSFDHLWAIAAIILFVLLGATIQPQTLSSLWFPGTILLAIGLILGRSLGWWLSTLGSNWTTPEKLFLLPGNSAKATVQAAIGAIPLSLGLDHGAEILAIAALSILITAPLGAWAIPYTAPKLLTKGTVDPTTTNPNQQTILLTAVDTSPLATEVLKKTADLARRTNAQVILLHVINHPESENLHHLKQQAKQHLRDITYQWLTPSGTVPETIIEIAHTQQVTAIVIGKKGLGKRLLMGSVSQTILETSSIPVTVVAAP